MAIITLNKKLFEKEIGKADEKMQSRISMLGTPVELINENEIQIDVPPNRPDLLSYHGFKRAFLGFLGKKTGLKDYKINKPEKNYEVIIDSSVKDVRPFTACAIIKGLNLDDEKIKEIIDLQEKLHTTIGRKRKKVAIGIYPLEKIKLPITFRALEPDKIKFIPLESEREMSGLEILQKHQTGKEYAHLLAGKIMFPIFVDANENILSMPPIINSHLTGKVTEETKEVFIECSGFDFKILGKTINILATSFAEMGGKIHGMELKYPSEQKARIFSVSSKQSQRKEITPDLKPGEMKISLENANKLLGLNLNEKQLKEFVEKMGYNYRRGKVEIPAWRTDVLHEVDLIEDVAIAYGYENFVPEIPEISTIGEENQREIIKRKISEIFTGLGFLEISSYHLTNKKWQFENMNVKEKDFIEVEESKTDYNLLRKDLSHNILKIFSENSDSEYPQKIFEIGRVFENKNKITEKENLVLAVSPGNFTDVKQAFEYLSKMMNLDFDIKETDETQNYFVEGRVGKIILNEKEIGFMGEIHPKILRNWKIKMPVSLLEVNLEDIFEKLI